MISNKGLNPANYVYEKFTEVPDELRDSFSVNYEQANLRLGFNTLVIAAKKKND